MVGSVAIVGQLQARSSCSANGPVYEPSLLPQTGLRALLPPVYSRARFALMGATKLLGRQLRGRRRTRGD